MKIRIRILAVFCFVALLLLSTIVPMPVLASSATVYATKDSHMDSGSPTTPHGSYAQMVVGDDCRGLVEFSLSIPAAATITGATLGLYYTARGMSNPTGRTLYAQRLLRLDWSESTSTWNIYKTGSSWTTAGAGSATYDYTTVSQASATVPGSYGWMSWDVLSQVQYAQGAGTAVAFRIVDSSEDSGYNTNFVTTDAGGNIPKLTITYTLTAAPPSYAPTVSTGSYSDATDTTAKVYGTTSYVDSGLAIYEGFEWGADTEPLSDDGGNADWTISIAGGSKAEIDDSQHNTGSQSGRLYRDGSNNPSAYMNDCPAADPQTLALSIRKDTNNGFAIYYGNGIRFLNIWVYDTEDIKFRDDGGYVDTGSNIAVTTWTDFEFVIDWAGGTYDIYVDGYMIYEDAGLRTGSTTTNQLWLASTAGTSEVWFDDIGFRPYIAERGFQYGLTATPTWSKSEIGLYGTGSYSLTLTGLSGATEYHYRAFVTNEEGTAYGSWGVFSTLDTPTITTQEASNVAGTTARLNSALTSDGGGDCTIEFGWGLTSESVVEDYDSYDTVSGTFNTGEYPYLDVEGMLTGQTYYFRVNATNVVGTVEGDELTFETSSGIYAPSNFVGYPESTSISLSWSKGAGSTNTLIRLGTSSYPTGTGTGTYAYSGPASTYTVESLTTGTTYYFSAWGESGGNYSATYSTFLMTTSAATTTTDTTPDVPGEPSRWFNTDYTAMSGLGLIYEAVNGAADTGDVPRATAWFILAIGLAFLAGLLTLAALKKNLFIPMMVTTVVLALEYFMKQVPWWLPVIAVILVVTWSQTHKQVSQG